MYTLLASKDKWLEKVKGLSLSRTSFKDSRVFSFNLMEVRSSCQWGEICKSPGMFIFGETILFLVIFKTLRS